MSMVGAFFHGGGTIFHANSMKFCPPPYYMNIHDGGIFSCNRPMGIPTCGNGSEWEIPFPWQPCNQGIFQLYLLPISESPVSKAYNG